MSYRDFAQASLLTATLAFMVGVTLGTVITHYSGAHADARIIEEHGHLTDW